MKKAKGIKQRTMWAVFDENGYLVFKTISRTKKRSKELIYDHLSVFIYFNWKQYALKGYTVQKILVDIKIISK